MGRDYTRCGCASLSCPMHGQEREMGPIERELRAADPDRRAFIGMGHRAITFCIGAAQELRLEYEFCCGSHADEEVLSEAIEAAEALGL